MFYCLQTKNHLSGYVEFSILLLQCTCALATSLGKNRKQLYIMAGNVGIAIAWTISTFCPFVVGMISFVYWVYKNIQLRLSKKFATFYKSLLWINWGAVCCFWVVTTSDFIEIFRNLLIGTDFEDKLEQENLQFAFLLSTLCYISGKWLVYFVLYLRLKYTLRKSAYSYSQRTYNTIKMLIIIEIVCTLLATSLFIIADDGIIYIIGQIMAIPFIFLDIGIPIGLNIMFIKKTYEIGKTYFRIMSMSNNVTNNRSNASSSVASSNNNNSNNNNNMSGERAKSVSVSENHRNNNSGNSSDKNTIQNELESQINDNDINKNEETSSTKETSNNNSNNNNNNKNNNNNDGSKPRSVSIDMESEKDLSELFEAISKIAVLAVIIALSSFLFFIGFAIGTTFDELEPFIYLSRMIDSAFNIVCLILAFEFAKKWFKNICGKFQNCCKNQIEKRVKNDLFD